MTKIFRISSYGRLRSAGGSLKERAHRHVQIRHCHICWRACCSRLRHCIRCHAGCGRSRCRQGRLATGEGHMQGAGEGAGAIPRDVTVCEAQARQEVRHGRSGRSLNGDCGESSRCCHAAVAL